MKTVKTLFSAFGLIVLMVVIIPASAVIAVGIGFLLLIEDTTTGEAPGLGLILLLASPISFIVLVVCLERELLTYWSHREDSALGLILD